MTTYNAELAEPAEPGFLCVFCGLSVDRRNVVSI